VRPEKPLIQLAKHHNAIKAAAVEGLVPLILELAEFPGRAVALVLRRLEAEKVESLQAAGTRLRDIFDSTLRLLEGIGEQVQVQQESGYEINGADRLRAALAALRNQREALMQNWPWDDRPWPRFDPAVTAASRAALARGEILTLQEFARELGRALD